MNRFVDVAQGWLATCCWIGLTGLILPVPESSGVMAPKPSAAPPSNVLFIAIDDLNDWVGTLDTHPAARTPVLDRLAERGTTFLNAHCQAPLCNPSRSSVLLGLRPSTTGIYGLQPAMRAVKAWENHPTILQWFARHGYHTLAAGKVDHARFRGGSNPAGEVHETGPWGGPGEVFPATKHAGETPMGNNPWMDWGAHPHDETKKGDYQVAEWAAERLQTLPPGQPFFMALGFFLPHVPTYVTPEQLAAVPTEGVLPPVLADDRVDVPDFAWYLHWRLPEPRLRWMREHGQLQPYVRAYLASTTWIDGQIGRVLEALASAGFAENTLVVVWGDNGMHFGEKGVTGKNTLWERSTRVPLLVAGPGVARGGRVAVPVELLDLYPTLADLAGLQEDLPPLEGITLRPQLEDATTPRQRPALTTANPGNHAVRSERYRYIRYADGAEEFYDHLTDPHEWRNLAGDPAVAALMVDHRRWLPTRDAPHVADHGGRTLEYDPDTGIVKWEGEVVPAGSPVPE